MHNVTYRTCGRCGWVHFGMSRKDAEEDVRRFNHFFDSETDEVREMYGNKRSEIRNYERCFFCHAPFTCFKPFKEGDCPDGVTMQPIIDESL